MNDPNLSAIERELCTHVEEFVQERKMMKYWRRNIDHYAWVHKEKGPRFYILHKKMSNVKLKDNRIIKAKLMDRD